MSTSPPPGSDPSRPSFAEENAMRIASESLSHYDEAADTYHCSYGAPVPAVTIHDVERGLLVRVEPRSRQVVGFSIPQFKAWHAANADDSGEFEVDLPSLWPLGPDEAPASE
jgi:hypothetical protein